MDLGRMVPDSAFTETGKSQESIKKFIEMVRLMAEKQPTAQQGGTEGSQAIWWAYLFKPHDISNPQKVFRQQIQKCQEIELWNILVLPNRLFQETPWCTQACPCTGAHGNHFVFTKNYLDCMSQICGVFQLFSKLSVGFK